MGPSREGKARIILGECKDRAGSISADDVANMNRICERLPNNRFDAFVLFAKLSAFSTDEIALARTLNDRYRQRVILLTHEELEPYYLFDRSGQRHGIDQFASTPSQLAAATAKMYFSDATAAVDPGR